MKHAKAELEKREINGLVSKDEQKMYLDLVNRRSQVEVKLSETHSNYYLERQKMLNSDMAKVCEAVKAAEEKIGSKVVKKTDKLMTKAFPIVDVVGSDLESSGLNPTAGFELHPKIFDASSPECVASGFHRDLFNGLLMAGGEKSFPDYKSRENAAVL